MIFPDELTERKLYKNPLGLPLNDNDTRKGSAVFLLSPDLESSMNILKNPILRKRYYSSYYMEKDMMLYIKEDKIVDSDDDLEPILEDTNKPVRTNRDVIKQYHLDEYIEKDDEKWLDEPFEDPHERGVNKIYSKESSIPLLENCIKDTKLLFETGKLGIDITYEEDVRKYVEKFKYNTGKLISLFFLILGSPLAITSGIILLVYGAIGVAFAYNAAMSDKEKFQKMAKEKIERARERDRKKLEKNTDDRQILIDRLDAYDKLLKEINKTGKVPKSYKDIIKENAYIRANDKENDIDMVFGFESTSLNEGALTSPLKQYLRDQRFKTPTKIIKRYKEVKEADVGITKTFLSLDKYKSKNLIIDLAYYNLKFFESGIFRKNKLRLYELYLNFLDRLLNDPRLPKSGYTKRTVIYPLIDWQQYENTPLDLMLYAAQKRDTKILDLFKDIDFIVLTDYGYFKLAMNNITFQDRDRINTLTTKLINKEPIDDDTIDSKKAIVVQIADTIETNKSIKIHNLVGDAANKDKDDLIKTINDKAEKSTSTEDALDKLDKDNTENKWLNDIILKLANDEDEVNISATRRARMTSTQSATLDKKYKNRTFREMIQESEKDEELPETSLPIDTVNDDWKHLTFMNFEKTYDYDADIIRILNFFSEKDYPIAIRDIQIENTSTSEDYIKTYYVSCEDSVGQRFKLIFDVPKFIDEKFMWLRGNKKTFNRQLLLIPLSKTDTDTAQIVSNYKKIFIRTYGLSTPGKSCADADAIIKISKKYTGDKVKFELGDNKKICDKYDCPIDFVDLAGYFSYITSKDSKFYFDLDVLYKEHGDLIDKTKGLPIGTSKQNGKTTILYWNMDEDWTYSQFLRMQLSMDDKEIDELSKSIKPANKYWYSQASILNSKIPLIVVAAYSYGLTTVLEKAGIKYTIEPKKDRGQDTFIKFSDGYLLYQDSYDASLLLNGLKECPTEMYPLSDMNNKSMYLDFLDDFGGRLLSDGLNNFKELMVDPITSDSLKRYRLPEDYLGLLLAANELLSDNKYIDHTCLDSNRYRSTEIMGGYTYLCLANAYGTYRSSMQKGRKVPMTMKRTAILDAILADPTIGDASDLGELSIAEAMTAVSSKGLSGMNSDRSYSLDKRTYDDSMLNTIAMSTSFAGNVGVNRQMTINANIEGKRGFIRKAKKEEMSTTNTFCFTEAINSYTATHDDPFRMAMTYIQSSKHAMRVKYGMPSLVTNGTDQALPYLTSNTFSVNSKNKGKIVEKTDDYMVVQYKDGTSEYISLEEKIVKNSNGGFYIVIKLDSDLKVGDTVHPNQILASDKQSYSSLIGTGDLAYIMGPMVKCVIMDTDEGYEDSAIISDWLSEAMASDVVEKQEYVLSKDAIIYDMIKKGSPVKEGQTILLYQNAFDNADVNQLLKTLNNESPDDIEELGRINKTSHVEGVVQDITIYRTCEKDELSPSLKAIVDKYERDITKKRKAMEKYDIDAPYMIKPDYKLEPTGQLKNVEDGVKIVFQLKYEDKMGVGDKLVYYAANKGTVKDIFPKGKECRTSFRPNELVHTLVSIGAVNGRMVTSILNIGGLNKGIIELTRKVKDILGIKWDYLETIMEDQYK